MSYTPPITNCATCGEPIRPGEKVWGEGELDANGNFYTPLNFKRFVCCKVPS